MQQLSQSRMQPSPMQQLHPDIKRFSLHALVKPICHRHIVLCAQCELRLAHSGVDRPAFVHRERPVPVIDEEAEVRRQALQFDDHSLHLPEIFVLHLGICSVNFVRDVIVEGTEKVISDRARIQVLESIPLSCDDAPIPFQRQICTVHAAPYFSSCLPDVPQCALPASIKKLGAVREQCHVLAGGIKLADYLLRKSRYCESAGALPRDQKLFRFGEQFFSASGNSFLPMRMEAMKFL